jgi:phosphate/sulfate permease
LDFHIIIVGILLLLAAIDLTVGVANDAVNFLNSALGAQAGKFKFLLAIAAVGVLVGVLFSSGMMEVARKGIFNPEYFLVSELLIIFVAVMLQDILLLDFFNKFGLPTSTTVSLVFGLFGSALAISTIKIISIDGTFALLNTYINTNSVLKIVSAILLSIIFAFVFGALAQYLSRLLFTFDYEKRFKRYGGLWSGIGLTILSIFIIIKGAKGATFIDDTTSQWMKDNIWTLALYLFIFWTLFIQFFISFTKLDILKFIVWVGTFALAMAFAANDLVNFIGAPLAGLNAYQISLQFPDPLTAPMDALKNPVKAQTYLLIIAGLIMVVTLFVSRKARNVAKTTINLGRQNEGFERFEANDIARAIVRIVVSIFSFFRKITNEKTRRWISDRFDQKKFQPKTDENGVPQAFDLIRAAVILIVSAGLISLATSLKLPLSTTYVTFIVAMAAALPDNAWGRESAVYRVSGVITVVGGWFFTAFMASLVAGLIAIIIYYTEFVGLFVILGLTIFTLYSSMKSAKEKDIQEEKELKKIVAERESPVVMFDNTMEKVYEYLINISDISDKSIKGLTKYKLNKSSKSYKKSLKLNKEATFIIKKLLQLLKYTPEAEIESEKSFIKVLSSFQEIADRLQTITKNNLDYLENNHHELTEVQIDDLTNISDYFEQHVKQIAEYVKFKNFANFDDFKEECQLMQRQIQNISTQQLKRIKNFPTNYTRSLLILNLLNDMNSLFSDIYNIGLTCKEIEIFLNENVREDKVDLEKPTKPREF